MILPGVNLGRNCVVAAGAVVRPGTYPDHCVIAGVPGRIVRRYDPETGWNPPLRTDVIVRRDDADTEPAAG